ncbi:MAG: hypothetical protein EOO90_03825 [Pedobacter sp.]|nr:MAG: hypothetical protein EOO90_03825 [Pedobacter sp.]
MIGKVCFGAWGRAEVFPFAFSACKIFGSCDELLPDALFQGGIGVKRAKWCPAALTVFWSIVVVVE